MDLKLDTSTGDLAIANNRLSMITDDEYVAQAWKIRLLTFLGEWFLDQRIGIPYFEHILIKNPNWPLVRSLFRQASYSVSGIREITSLDLSLAADTRTLSVDMTGVFQDFTTFKFTFTDMIISVGREVTA